MYKKIYRSMRIVAFLTLITASVLILSAAYTTVDSELRRELREETLTCAALLEASGNAAQTIEVNRSAFGNKRTTLISPNGEVLFDSYADKAGLENHNKRPEIARARKDGVGEAERLSVTSSKKYYYCAVRLSDGSVFRMASSAHDFFAIFATTAAVVLVMAILIFILSSIVAAQMTKNIVKPLEKLTMSGENVPKNTYPELEPLLARIASQHGEIRRQMTKVSMQKHQMQTITDNMNEGFAVLDSDGVFLSANKSALGFLGNKILNTKYNEISADTIITDSIAEALDGEYKTAVIEKGNVTYRGIFSPVRRGEKTDGAIVLLLDITQTAEAEKMRREFSSNVSHELKTPLTSIHGYSQLLASGMAKDNTVLFAQKIEKESSRMITLIDDIMRLSNLDENNESIDKSDFSLAAAASEAAEMLAQFAKEKNVTLRTGGEDCTVCANRRQVIELIYDLCDNAIKYNRSGGSVTVTVWNNRLTVTDTGIGIPQEDIGRIFERFYRVDKSHSRKVNGTGLGLSIVKHLARLNNIEISVSSKVGEGSSFTLTFSSLPEETPQIHE